MIRNQEVDLVVAEAQGILNELAVTVTAMGDLLKQIAKRKDKQ